MPARLAYHFIFYSFSSSVSLLFFTLLLPTMVFSGEKCFQFSRNFSPGKLNFDHLINIGTLHTWIYILFISRKLDSFEFACTRHSKIGGIIIV